MTNRSGGFPVGSQRCYRGAGGFRSLALLASAISRGARLQHPNAKRETVDSLLAAAVQGDGEALGRLLATYRQYLVFLARTQLHDRMRGKADPSDIAQEVFLAAHQNLDEFRGASAEEFASWLRGILANVIAMHLRRYLGTQKRDPRMEQGLNRSLANASNFLQSGVAGDFTTPSQQFARHEAFLELAAALESLPPDYYRVIVLRHVEGLPFAEVARAMDRSVDSVEKLWVRALSKLRQAINDPSL